MNGRMQEGEGPEGGAKPLESGAGNVRSAALAIQLAAEQIWTTEELLAAEPCDLIQVDIDQLKKAMEEALAPKPESLTGEEGGIQTGGAPEMTAAPPTGAEPTATAGGYNYPPPYNRHEVFCPYNIFPYITIGVLFFQRNGIGYRCSAASIGNYAVWTAGHCVHSGNPKDPNGGWSTKVVFVPAYKDGSAPYGQWPASHLWTRTAWYNGGSLCEDMGGAVLFLQGGKKISQAVGWLGFAWNWSRYQLWHALGYPVAAPFNGRRLFDSQGSFAYTDPYLKCNPLPHAIGSDQTGGCSGGPWIWRFGTGNYLNGNNSYRYIKPNHPEEIYSPYFGNEAKALRDALVNSTP